MDLESLTEEQIKAFMRKHEKLLLEVFDEIYERNRDASFQERLAESSRTKITYNLEHVSGGSGSCGGFGSVTPVPDSHGGGGWSHSFPRGGAGSGGREPKE